MPGQAPLTAVIVTFNSSAMLPGLLDSISAGVEGAGPYQVIVVDNNSRDASVSIARQHPEKPIVIEMGSNAGYAAAINAAMDRMDRNSYLLVLNPDLRMHPGAAKALLKRLEDPTVGIAVPRNYKEDGSTAKTIRQEPTLRGVWAEAVLGGHRAARLGYGEVMGNPALYESEQSVDWATGSALMVSPAARTAAGKWDESFFLYSEEVDYQRRVREAGFKIIYEPNAKVMHKGGDSGVNPKLFALLTANRIRYFRRHHGPVSTLLFRAAIGLGGIARCRREVHRAGLKSVLNPEGTVVNFLANRPV
ncbi:MAG: glycosyltransferase family 2 protein [Rhizobiaceae bacterium]|nr:glycosyltransferase family 2 protein [Rhizobiaceae bacterium]